jgi:hypothetical protein
MSERPTPETDAFFYRKEADLKTIWLCERLERERDKWEETARLYGQNSDFHREMREKAERERDEAREQIAKLRAELVQLKEVAQ